MHDHHAGHRGVGVGQAHGAIVGIRINDLDTGEGRGFTFANINAADMVWVIREAVELYHGDKKAWRDLQKAGMTADFSWDASAKQYSDIYERICKNP